MQIAINKDDNGKLTFTELTDDMIEDPPHILILNDKDVSQIHKIIMHRPIDKIIVDRRELESVVCNIIGISPDKLKIKTRKKEIVIARQLIFFVFYLTRFDSCSHIGKIYNKDHATVFYAVRKCENALNGYDPVFKKVIIKVLKYFDLWNEEKQKVIRIKNE